MGHRYFPAHARRSGRTIAAPLILAILSFIPLSGQTIEVYPPVEGLGASPAQVIADTAAGFLHVLCSGYDANYNGIVEPDEGDVAASWHILDRQGNQLDSISFNTYFNSYPVRAAADFVRGRLYAPVGKVVRAYDLQTMDLLDDTVANLPAAGITVDQERELLALSVRPDFTNPGTIHYVDPEDGSLRGWILAGPNPADGFTTEVDERTGAYRIFTLNEGNGSGTASLSMVGWTTDIYSEPEEFGGGADQGLLHDDRAYFVLSDASMIRVLDATTHTDVSGSPIGIPGDARAYGIDVSEDWVAVIAEQGTLLVYDRTSLSLLHTLKVPGTARRVAIGDGRLYVAGPVNSKGVPTTAITVAATDGTNRTVEVGSMPSNIWSLGENRVLVVGEDNGADEGWWSVVEVESGDAIRSGTIPGASFDGGIRAAFNREAMTLGVLIQPELIEIDITVDGAEPEVAWNPEDAYADRLVAADGIWYLANFPGDFVPEPTWVYGVELGSGRELGRVMVNVSTPVLPVPGRSSVDGAGAFYAIPTPGYGGPDPSLVWVEHHRNIFEGDLGVLANHIARGESHCREEPMTMVTVGGSHEVVMLDDMAGNPTIGLRTPTGTSGFDGPRTTVQAPCVPAIFCGAVMTTTYDGQILLLYEGEVIARADLGGRGEGLALLGDSVWAANVLEKGTFDVPMYSVAPAFVKWPGSVPVELLPEESIAVSPGTIVDRMQVTLRLERSGEVATTLLDIRGRRVMAPENSRVEAGSTTFELDLSPLPAGMYLLHCSTPEGLGVRTVRVVR